MKKAIPVFILIILAGLLILPALSNAADSNEKQPKIYGIVTDTNGVPIQGVEVTAKCGIMGNILYRLVSPNTWTDENGRFSLPVDFPDVSYSVTFRYMYNNSVEMKIIPQETGLLNVQLRIRTSQIVRGVVLNSSDSSPVEGATVRYFGEYQRFIIEKKTDDQGQFEITELPTSQGQSVIYAQKDNQVSPVNIVVRIQNSDPAGNINLRLNNGAELWGTVKLEGTDKPIKNCTVSITTFYMSGYSMQTTTDANGLYRFRDLPPGEYKVTAQNNDYFKYEERASFIRDRMTLSSGQKLQKDMTLKKRMKFEGKVVDLDGKPVAGAIVAIDEAHVSENQYSPFVVHTDEKGNFSITTGRIYTTPVPKLEGLDALKQLIKGYFTKRPTGEDAIDAFSSTAGYGRFQFYPYREGDVIRRVKIQLNGMIRLHGKVTDPNGNPLKDIEVYDNTGSDAFTYTNENGEYDLGKFPIRRPDKKEGTVNFLAPRPDATVHYSFQGKTISFENVESYTNETGLFHHNHKNYVIEPGKDIEINAIIEPTDLITLYGTASDQNNMPLEKAQIVLFRGNADPNTWYNLFELSGRDYSTSALTIQITGIDNKGFWKIYIARETLSDLEILLRSSSMDLNPNLFSFGVYKNRSEHVLVQDIIIKEGEMEKEINIKLAKTDDPNNPKQ